MIPNLESILRGAPPDSAWQEVDLELPFDPSGFQSWGQLESEIMRQAEQQSFEAADNATFAVTTEQARAAERAAARNENVTDALARQGVAIPEAFLDEITSVLMSDPVELPASRRRVDRSTIMRHLEYQRSDPFNRQPLEPEQVTPLDGLRAEIVTFLGAHGMSLGEHSDTGSEHGN